MKIYLGKERQNATQMMTATCVTDAQTRRAEGVCLFFSYPH